MRGIFDSCIIELTERIECTTITLNENQQRAVEHHNGSMMVLAGPGSGKTTVIIGRVQHLITQFNIPPERILVITFSKSAADQMQKRYTDQFGPAAVTFGTFHAVFFRILRHRYRYGADRVLTEEERRHVVGKILSAFQFEIEDEFLSAVLNEISLVKNELYDLRYYNSATIGTEEFKQLFEQYESFKQEEGKIDFDDMLVMCYQLFREEPAYLSRWQQKYPYIMIDEFQDINHVQYECIRLLAAPGYHLFIVGDDDQSIYRFRGARPEFLLRFPKDYKNTAQVVLDTNYRSTDAIIQFSNKLIAENQYRYEKQIIGTKKKGTEPIIFTTEDQNQEAAVIAAKIKAMQKKDDSLNEIAVIYRTNLQARALIDAFMHTNIPYQVKDEMSVIYEHWVAKDLYAYMRLSRDFPNESPVDLERIINKPFRFISRASIANAKKMEKSLFSLYTTDPTLHLQQRTRIEELLFYLRAIQKRNPADAIRYIRQAVAYDGHIIEYARYRRLNPDGLLEIADELQEAAKQFKRITDYLNHADEAIAAAKQKTNKKNADCVTLTTMHSAKGLEYGTVFIAGMVEGVIPHGRSKSESELEEERRLFYVGATRAKHTLYLSVLRTRYDKPVKPSRFLT